MRRDLSPKCIKGMMILDSDGKRILSKYYDDAFNNTKEQKAFEKKLYAKTHKANAEIVMLDGFVCVYKSNVDLYFGVIGGCNENELILQSVLNCFYESVCQILKKNVDKKNLFSNLDMIMLAMDEICESGIILEVDANNVMSRIAQRGDDLTFAEQTVAQVGLQVGKSGVVLNCWKLCNVKFVVLLQVIQSAKEQLKWSLLK
ncbi:Coatomer subunit zeta-1 [Trichinella pseudospiralis]|uniref:Coatomer subunit zeta n=1 Tax=Trichinella pseudospiralis TaxID=6337 RepID=A0A0V1FV64_TRIPS|nr:Coatomer subunit zeta-1 [Trichinella pseudospiralis]